MSVSRWSDVRVVQPTDSQLPADTLGQRKNKILIEQLEIKKNTRAPHSFVRARHSELQCSAIGRVSPSQVEAGATERAGVDARHAKQAEHEENGVKLK
jgi:hypothetical protein